MNEHSTPGGPEATGPNPPQTSFEFSGGATGGEPSASHVDAGVRLTVDDDGVGWIFFDLPGEKVNKLTIPLMEALRDLIDEAGRKRVSALVFASDKPDMFIAGVDVAVIAGVTDPQIGMEKAAYGQAVFEAIARFAKPTAAVISGPCVGGGYELALACDYLVAEKKDAVRVGLPEVKLGILPGFGGTQRLPRRIGVPKALDIILSGKTVPAKPAFRRGMVDALVPAGEGCRVAKEIVTGARKITRRPISRMDKLMVSLPPLRNFVFKRAGQTLAKKAPRQHYPGPHMALEAVEAGFIHGEVAAYRTEARLLGEAIVTETSKNLAWLFNNSGKAKEPKDLDLGRATDVKRLAVVGAGIMGGGIAWLAGERNIPIRIKDIAPEPLQHALATAGKIWTTNMKRRRITRNERSRRLEKLSFSVDYTGFNLVDFAVEAIVEDLGIKQTVVGELESVLSEDAVIASNTSSLRIADIAAKARRPERIVGLHFFNPVNRMPLVEVVAGPQSADSAVATAYRLALRLGKTPILIQDGPGFLVNRLLTFYLAEALHLLEKGADPLRVDALLIDFGMPMGPFELMDQIGIDVGEKVTHVMEEAFGDRLPGQATLGRLAAAGHFGKKSGQGFYLYKSGKKTSPAPEAMRAAGNPSRWDPPAEDVLDRLLLPMVNEAARCLAEGIVNRPLDVDLGMVMGTGFPPFRGGLLRYADHRGIDPIMRRLDGLADSVSPRFVPSDALRQRTGGFYRL